MTLCLSATHTLDQKRKALTRVSTNTHRAVLHASGPAAGVDASVLSLFRLPDFVQQLRSLVKSIYDGVWG
jgi:hypothetical protein